MQNDLPEWLRTLVICGREDDDDDKGKEGENNDEGDDDEDDGEKDEGEDEGDDSGDGEDDQKKRADALEASLKKERKLRRQAERDARKAAKTRADSQEEKDSAALKKQLEEQEAKTKKLAEGFRKSAVDKAILDAARDLGFIDPTDALLDDIRNSVDVDQDDEDPSDIDIDEDTVTDAVKKLAKRKKHLIGAPGDGERSGGKFRRRNQQGSDEATSESVLAANYPSLRS